MRLENVVNLCRCGQLFCAKSLYEKTHRRFLGDAILGKWFKGTYPEPPNPGETSSLLSHRSICKSICTSAVIMQQSAANMTLTA